MPISPYDAPEPESQYQSKLVAMSPYDILRSERKEIRILSLDPGTWEEQISCQLSTISLNEDHPPYEALSYVWDAEPGFEEILLCGQPRTITRNLFLALRRLRQTKRLRMMWVDALCIHQENDNEKSHQVGLMGEIYTLCRRVYLWLGDYPNGSTRIIEGNNDFPWFGGNGHQQDMIEDDVYQAFNLLHELSQNKHFTETTVLSSKNEETAIADHGAFEAFTALMESTWWERLWVVQETVLPTEAIFVFGSISANWQTIVKAERSLYLHRRSCCSHVWSKLNNKGKNTFHIFARAVSALEATKYDVKHGIDFYVILWRYRNRKASDPRDNIYGLWGVARRVIGKIEPDYSLSKVEVYEQATLLCLEESGGLNALKGQRIVGGELPSWVYDGSLPIDAAAWNDERLRMRTEVYEASLGVKARVSKAGMSRISLDAVYIDRVAAVGGECPRNRRGAFRAAREWYNMAESFYSQSPPSSSTRRYENTSNWKNGFRRTLCADVAIHGISSWERKLDKRAPVDKDVAFEAWWSLVESDKYHGLKNGAAAKYWDNINCRMATGRSFFITQNGHMGLGCPKVGDEIWVLLGGDVPFVLRPAPDSIEHYLVGDCFLLGFMNGEAMECLEQKRTTVVLR